MKTVVENVLNHQISRDAYVAVGGSVSITTPIGVFKVKKLSGEQARSLRVGAEIVVSHYGSVGVVYPCGYVDWL